MGGTDDNEFDYTCNHRSCYFTPLYTCFPAVFSLIFYFLRVIFRTKGFGAKEGLMSSSFFVLPRYQFFFHMFVSPVFSPAPLFSIDNRDIVSLNLMNSHIELPT